MARIAAVTLRLAMVAFALGIGIACADAGAKARAQAKPVPANTGSFTIELGAEEAALPAGSFGLISLPDGHVSMLWTGNEVSLWLSAGVHGYLLRGSSLETVQPVPSKGQPPAAVLEPSGTGFDSEYAAFGAVFPSAVSGELIGLYHGEQCGRTNYTATIGVATSTDGGITWQRNGAVITGRDSTDFCGKRGPRGAGQPSVVRAGEYLYAYYTDWSGDIPDQIHMARAPLAMAATPGAWQKYYQYGFTEPGIGGNSTPVIRRPEPGHIGVYAANPSVSFNTYLGRYLALFDASDGFYVVTSTDGLLWDTPRKIMLFPRAHNQLRNGDAWYSYGSLISPSELSHLYTSDSGYLYYARGVKGVAPHYMVRRPFVLRLSGEASDTSTRTSHLPPTSRMLAAGDEVLLPAGGIWVCTGDIAVRRDDGSVEKPYDDDPMTGQVMLIDVVGQRLLLVAPYGGACVAVDPTGPSPGLVVEREVYQAFSTGCTWGCIAVRVVILDASGNVSTAQWLTP